MDVGWILARPVVALGILVFIWGTSWPIYKVAVPYTPPLVFSGMRALIGGLFLVAIIYKSRFNIRWKENWYKYCISALFNVVLFFGIQTIGLLYLPGGLFATIVYFQPILLSILAWLWLGELLTPLRMFGLIVGFCGIVIVSMDGLVVHLSAIGVVLGLLTAFSWAYGVFYMKKVSQEIDTYWLVALQFVIGGMFLLGTGTVVESWSDIVWNGQLLFGLIFGGTIGIPVAYLLYYGLIQAGEASKVGSFTFLVPLISVSIGIVILGEPLTITLFVGLLLVGMSIYFVNYRGRNGGSAACNSEKGKPSV